MKTADLCDQYRSHLQVCAPLLRHFGKVRQFSGPVTTVRVLEDNALVKATLQALPAGAVLVVDGGGSLRCALVGDMLAAIAVSRGLAGIIVNGCVRDTLELASLDLGVMALAPNPLPPAKTGSGERDVPVAFGGVTWTPGQWVYADQDGVVLAPRPLHEQPGGQPI